MQVSSQKSIKYTPIHWIPCKLTKKKKKKPYPIYCEKRDVTTNSRCVGTPTWKPMLWRSYNLTES